MDASMYDMQDRYETLVGHQNAELIGIVSHCLICLIPFKKKCSLLRKYKRSAELLVRQRRPSLGGRSL